MPSTVPVNLAHHRYDVIIGPNLLDSLGPLVRAATPHDRCALIGDEAIMPLHGQRAAASLSAAGYRVTLASMPSGESHKSLDIARRLYDTLLDDRLERRSPVIALGGGVTGDTVGFVAATYLRGVPFIQVPTTLLAMVDAGVGGKVGVNVPQGKNLIGAFHQPALVVADVSTLQTLPPRELRCGLAECIKHALIRDADLLAWIADRLQQIHALKTGVMEELVRRNVAIKAAVVVADEKETGERAHLNFGHTFAHAIEAATDYGRFLHGEAVSLGMIAAARLAVAMDLCDNSVVTALHDILSAASLPVSADLPPTDRLMAAMRLDKKVADARIRFVLPTRIGHVVIRDDISDDTVRIAWDSIRQ